MTRAEQRDEAERLTLALTARCSAEQVAGARRTVADHAVRAGLNVYDTVELLEMLGLGHEVQV